MKEETLIGICIGGVAILCFGIGCYASSFNSKPQDLWWICDTVYREGNVTLGLWLPKSEQEKVAKDIEIVRLKGLSDCYRKYR